MQRVFIIGLILFLVELSVITFTSALSIPYLSPILLLICPIALGILGLTNGNIEIDNSLKRPSNMLIIRVWVLAIIVLAFVFVNTPISIKISDTIPIMRTAVEKLLAGKFPYSIIEEDWGYKAFCTYMPMHWLPMAIPYSLGIDMRWIAALAFVQVNLLYLWQYAQKQLDNAYFTFNFPIASLLPPLFLMFIPINEPLMLGQTMELLIVAYYMFLVYALFSEKIGLQILAISLCVLSRYSLILWLPLWVGLMFFYDDKTKALKLTGGIVLAILIAYIIPFWLKDTSIFSQAMSYYDVSSARLWQMMDPKQQLGEVPFMLQNGGSLAIYFYRFVEGNIPYKLQVLKYTQLIVSGLFVVLAFVAYPFFQKKIGYKLYAIYCLPIYLGIFYAFMLVPFMYLQLVPCGVMMALLMIKPKIGNLSV